jgi:predicted protein tyrosine phosphatase
VGDGGAGDLAGTSAMADLLEWADVVFAMEQRHADLIRRHAGRLSARVTVLGIPDRYGDPDLVRELELERRVRLPDE